MMKQISPELLGHWNTYGEILALIASAIGICIILIYYIKLVSTREHKKRYDYINMHEIDMLWNGILFILIGLTLYVNTLVITTTWLWFFVRLFTTSMFAVILGVIIQNSLKFYYPFYIEKRLKRLRYTPRVSPDGRKMKLLSEEEEDVFLDEGMQAEENVFSVDYDVWIDETSGFTKIEKYNGRFHVLKCAKCSYQTLRVDREEIVQEATETEEGELIKHYVCGYCSHRERKSFHIAKQKELS